MEPSQKDLLMLVGVVLAELLSIGIIIIISMSRLSSFPEIAPNLFRFKLQFFFVATIKLDGDSG